MNNKLSAWGGKKILFLLGALIFLAAACNNDSNQIPGPKNYQQPSSQSSPLDSALYELNTSLEIDSSINAQSDEDVVNSDQSVVEGYFGVSNEISY